MRRARILIVDDDTAYSAKLAGALEGVFRVETCHSEADFRDRYEPGSFDLLIVDMRLDKDREGIVLLREALSADPLQAAIVMTAYADMETYADALEAGAMTYLDKAEFSPALIARTVEAIVEQARMRRRVSVLEERLQVAEPLEIIGASPAIRRMREDLRRAAETDAAALLIGGPGAGKELVARNIHHLNRPRSDGPFIRAICRHGGRDDLTTALFGPVQALEKRRATGSVGWIEQARGGVLFLDGVDGLGETAWTEVGALLVSRRCKHPVNGRKIEADAQIIVSALPSSRRVVGDLNEATKAIRIVLPDLQEHIEDIALLAQYVLQGLYRDGRTSVRALRGAALTALERMPWPGNIRELQSAIAYAAIRAEAAGEREIGPEHLPASAEVVGGGVTNISLGGDYLQNLARAELAQVEAAIETYGTKTKIDLARRLGYNDRFVFSRRIRKCLTAYPGLKAEHPRTTEMMETK